MSFLFRSKPLEPVPAPEHNVNLDKVLLEVPNIPGVYWRLCFKNVLNELCDTRLCYGKFGNERPWMLINIEPLHRSYNEQRIAYLENRNTYLTTLIYVMSFFLIFVH
jgi:hypothetical protein